jgi:hypothetical protein
MSGSITVNPHKAKVVCVSNTIRIHFVEETGDLAVVSLSKEQAVDIAKALLVEAQRIA